MTRTLLPRETGLWSWVGAPLFATLLLAPTPATVAGIFAILVSFGAANAARARQPGLAASVGAVGLVLAVAAGALAAEPWHWLIAVAGVLIVAGWAATLVGLRRRGDPAPLVDRTLYEVGAIAGAAALSGALAAGSVPPGDALVVQLVVVTWELLGLWWVRGQLARVLPREPLPRHTAMVSVGASWALLAFAATPAAAPIAAIPALYGARVVLTRPATSPRDARRIGLGEAAWTSFAIAVTVIALRWVR